MSSKSEKDGNPWFVPVLVALIGAAATVIAVLIKPSPPAPEITIPTQEPQLNVTVLDVLSGRTYLTGKLIPGAPVYSDRDYMFNFVPSYLNGKVYIITANEDKFSIDDAFLRIRVDRDVIVYVAYSDRYPIKPVWLENFDETSDALKFNVDNDLITLELYQKRYPAGEIILGGNILPTETANHAMYVVVISPK